MNERIKELYEQAHDRKPTMVVDPQTGNLIQAGWVNKPMFHNEFNPEKFAELIVQRTLDIVEAHTEIFQSSEARAMVEHIKHSVKTDFGVEE